MELEIRNVFWLNYNFDKVISKSYSWGLDESINYGEDLGLKKVNTQGKDQIYQDNRADVQYVSAKYGGDMSNMYEEGEEYDLTLEELAEILANGGNVEFL